MKNILCMMILFAGLSACSLAPTYHRPSMAIPLDFKEAGKWVPAQPIKADKMRGDWWKMFHDPTLNALEERVRERNQQLKIAIARFQASRALVAIARADYFPTINADANATRVQTSGNIANKNTIPLYSDFLANANLSYEIDVWGRVRNNVLANEKRAKASAADVASIQLSLQTELASHYFALRGDDAKQKLLDNIVKIYAKSLSIIRKRYRGGIIPLADVYQAEAQLNQAKTLAADMRLKRAQLEHAIAILIGEAPSQLTLPAMPLQKYFVTVSPFLPSTLLERRPDIAAAERRVEAANADIGIARAAFFPDFNLSSQVGFESSTLAKLIRMPSLIWALGTPSSLSLLQPLASVNVFDGGRLQGLLSQATANYYESVAIFRQTVLSALQEVEDSLVAIRQLEKEYRTQHVATKALKRAVKQANDRYTGGIITYLDVAVVENMALQSALSEVDVTIQRHLSSIQLIKALGGDQIDIKKPR